jgi:predicted transposase/invertase (TIGR01784 family)
MSLKPARFLDPKTDIVFKKIFGQNPDLIQSFLNGVLPLADGHLIEEVTYLSTEQSPRIPAMKNTIVDVKCRDQRGRIFIVEMQLHWTNTFTKRLLFGASKAFVQQLGSGEEYKSLCPVYGLGVINAVFDSETEEWFHHYRTVNIKDSRKVLEGLELVFLELPKFKPQTFQHKKMGVLWLRFLREINDKLVDVPPEFLQSPELNKAMELAQESAYTMAELDTYDKYWDAIRVEKTFISDSFAKGRAEGEAKGRAEGEAKGRAEGEQIGIEKGKIETARKMLQKGMDLQLIADFTELPLEVIKAFVQGKEVA